MSDRNFGCRLQTDMVLSGNKALVMENQKLRLTILLDRGSDIVELLYKPKDIDFMWRSPVALHQRSTCLSNTGDSLGNYLDHNSGGWQEILPNGGAECVYKGAVMGMHGEISCVPWHCEVLRDDAECVSVALSIRTLRSPFALRKILTLRTNESAFRLEEHLTNEAHEPMELMWGHHPTLGEPFLCEECTIHTNAKRAFTLPEMDFATQRLAPAATFDWPIAQGQGGQSIDFSKIPARVSETADMLYLTDFPEMAAYRIVNRRQGLSFGMQWCSKQFPYLWMWLVCGGAYGYPWYGRTYNLALEPWTSYSGNGLVGSIQNRSSLKLEAQQQIHASLDVQIQEETNNE